MLEIHADGCFESEEEVELPKTANQYYVISDGLVGNFSKPEITQIERENKSVKQILNEATELIKKI